MAVVATSAINLGTVASAQYVSSEFTDAFAWLSDNGITSMPTEQAFAPFSAVTREQGAALITRGMKVIEDTCGETILTMDANASCSFGDASSIDGNLVSATNDACNYGLIKGYNGNFWPTQLMSRGQVMTVIGRALYGTQPEPAQYWSNYYSMLNADGIFTIENAGSNIMRYELGLVLHRIANSQCGDDTDGGSDLDDILCQLLGTCNDTTTPPTTNTGTTTPPTTNTGTTTPPVATLDGNLQVAVSSSSPASMDVPAGAIIHAVSYDLTAGTNETVMVYSMTLSREGLSNSSSIDTIAAFNNMGRITRARSENSDGEFTLSFSPALEIPAGSTEEIMIIVDTGPQSTAQSTQVVLDIVEVISNASVVYNSTLGATHEILNVTAATLEVDDDGSIADVAIGDNGAEVASFTFK